MIINNIGFNHTHDADFFIQRPSGSGDYLLILLKTPAIFTLNGKDVLAKANSFILYDLFEPQLYRVSGSTFSNDWLHFSATDEEVQWIKNLQIPFNSIHPLHDMLELSMIINSLSYENYSTTQKDYELIDLYMRILLIKLSKKQTNTLTHTLGSHFNRLSIVRTKIYNQPEINWNIEHLSHELAMSRSTFQHLYKKYFGVTPMEDVITSRIERAKYLLTSTNTSIQGISEFCGYHSDIHFMRQFKQSLNMTPSDFRKQAKLEKETFEHNN